MFGKGSLYGEIECIMGNGEVPYLGRGRGEGSPYSEVPCWGGGGWKRIPVWRGPMLGNSHKKQPRTE